jgi:hypothetical protein
MALVSRLDRLYDEYVDADARTSDLEARDGLNRFLPRLRQTLELDWLLEQAQWHSGDEGEIAVLEGVKGTLGPRYRASRWRAGGRRRGAPVSPLCLAVPLTTAAGVELRLEPVYDGRERTSRESAEVGGVVGVAFSLVSGDEPETLFAVTAIGNLPFGENVHYFEPDSMTDARLFGLLAYSIRKAVALGRPTPMAEQWLELAALHNQGEELDEQQADRAEDVKVLETCRPQLAKLLGVPREALLLEATAEPLTRLRLILDDGVSLYLTAAAWMGSTTGCFAQLADDDDPSLVINPIADNGRHRLFEVWLERRSLGGKVFGPWRARVNAGLARDVPADDLRRYYLAAAKEMFDRKLQAVGQPAAVAAVLGTAGVRPALEALAEPAQAALLARPAGLGVERA